MRTWLLSLGVPGCLAAGATGAEALRFAALGDIPYSDAHRERMPRWLGEISATQPHFLLHVGYFKKARESNAAGRNEEVSRRGRRRARRHPRVPFRPALARPALGPASRHFWRIEVPGWPMTGWVEVELETAADVNAGEPNAQPPVRATLRWLD